MKFFLLPIAVIILYCCSPRVTPSLSDYDENISEHRNQLEIQDDSDIDQEAPGPERSIPVVPEYDDTDQVVSLIDSIAYRNSDIDYITGYTIQVYNGGNREAANEAKQKVYEVLPEALPRIEYVQPNFKVKVGEFTERLVAQKVYTKLRDHFNKAIIIPERIQIDDL